MTNTKVKNTDRYMMSVVHGVVEDIDGYMPENSYNGSYFILKRCDWDCS